MTDDTKTTNLEVCNSSYNVVPDMGIVTYPMLDNKNIIENNESTPNDYVIRYG